MWQKNNSWVLALSAIVVATVSAGAEDANAKGAKLKAVVELFTSQGCSSCPPADALLKTYVDRPDVMALSFPVDYWDYLGWKDTFASPRFSERQRAYAKTRGDGSVYTPQIVVNGRLHEVGSRRRLIDKAIIAANRLAPLSVPVTFRKTKSTMLIDVGAAPEGAASASATIWLAVVRKSSAVNIRRGENGGRKINYYNVVRELTPVGMWTGKASTFKLDANSVTWPDTDACAVLIQDGIGGPIIGAAWMETM